MGGVLRGAARLSRWGWGGVVWCAQVVSRSYPLSGYCSGGVTLGVLLRCHVRGATQVVSRWVVLLRIDVRGAAHVSRWWCCSYVTLRVGGR